MLTRIEALGYRSLRYISQEVARFQTLVGPNGSGKSSFLDVVDFVGDMLRVGPYKAIVGTDQGVQRRATDLTQLSWMRSRQRIELAVELSVPEHRLTRFEPGEYGGARYELAIESRPDSQEVAIAGETLWLLPPPSPTGAAEDGVQLRFPYEADAPASLLREPKKPTPPGWKKVVSKIADSGNDYFNSETTGWNSSFRLGPGKLALANLPEDEDRFPISTWVKRFLMEGVQRIALNAQAIRLPSPRGSPSRYQSDGSNLPWVVHALAADPDRFDRWIAHFRTAVPDLRNVATVERPEDNHRYIIVEYDSGLRAPSWVVSDGTLVGDVRLRLG